MSRTTPLHLVLTSVLVLTALAAGCGQASTPPKPSPAPSGTASPAPGAPAGETNPALGAPSTPAGATTSGAEPAFQGTSTDLAAEFLADRAAFETKYQNKPVEVTGKVVAVGHKMLGEGDSLSLEGTPDKKNFTDIVIACLTEAQPWEKAQPGQTVRVAGTLTLIGDPSLMNARIIEVSGDAPEPLTAEALSKECTDDENAAAAKYKSRYLQVKGEIAEIKFNEAKAASVKLKTPEGSRPVVCVFTAFSSDQTQQLKVGQPVAVFGQFPSFLAGDVELMFCVLRAPKP